MPPLQLLKSTMLRLVQVGSFQQTRLTLRPRMHGAAVSALSPKDACDQDRAPAHQHDIDDEDLARAIAASLADSGAAVIITDQHSDRTGQVMMLLAARTAMMVAGTSAMRC